MNTDMGDGDDKTPPARNKKQANDTLYIATDTYGIVWYVSDRVPVTSSGLLPGPFASFLTSGQGRKRLRLTPGGSLTARLTGAWHNAACILELYQSRLRGLISRLQVCGPATRLGEANPDDPGLGLLRAKVYEAPSSMGGWHDVSAADAASYRLSVWHRGGNGNRPDFSRHPLCRQASLFVPDGPSGVTVEEGLMRVIAEIVDPRWWRMPPLQGKKEEEESSGKDDADVLLCEPTVPGALYEHFGMKSPGGLRYPRRRSHSSRDARRCLIKEVSSAAADSYSSYCSSSFDVSCPSYSLCKKWAAGKIAGLRPFAACAFLLEYLVLSWLDLLSTTHRGRIFSPLDFFEGDRSLAAAWRGYCGSYYYNNRGGKSKET